MSIIKNVSIQIYEKCTDDKSLCLRCKQGKTCHLTSERVSYCFMYKYINDEKLWGILK